MGIHGFLELVLIVIVALIGFVFESVVLNLIDCVVLYKCCLRRRAIYKYFKAGLSSTGGRRVSELGWCRHLVVRQLAVAVVSSQLLECSWVFYAYI